MGICPQIKIGEACFCERYCYVLNREKNLMSPGVIDHISDEAFTALAKPGIWIWFSSNRQKPIRVNN
jgi:hypothetical protein